MLIKDELLDIENIKSSKKPLLDLFIRRTAVLTSTQESITESIIRFQWEQANKATRPESEIYQINVPNLGTFCLSRTKSMKRVKKLKEHISNDYKKEKNQLMLESINRKLKLDEN